MNEYLNNFHSHSPTKMVSWLLLPHLPDGGVLLVMLNFLSQTLTLKQHSFTKKKTNPNPDHTFYWHPLFWICAFLHAYSPHPTPHPHPALFLDIFCSLMQLKLFIIFCFIYHDVRCNKCLPFQLCSSWKVLSPWRGDIFYLHPPPFPSLPPSGWVSEKWG